MAEHKDLQSIADVILLALTDFSKWEATGNRSIGCRQNQVAGSQTGTNVDPYIRSFVHRRLLHPLSSMAGVSSSNSLITQIEGLIEFLPDCDKSDGQFAFAGLAEKLKRIVVSCHFV